MAGGIDGGARQSFAYTLGALGVSRSALQEADELPIDSTFTGTSAPVTVAFSPLVGCDVPCAWCGAVFERLLCGQKQFLPSPDGVVRADRIGYRFKGGSA